MPSRESRSRLTVGKCLEVHLTDFLTGLAAVGYAKKTLSDKERLILPFVRWICDARIGITDLDEDCLEAFLTSPSRRRYNHHIALRQFLAHLRHVGAVSPRRFDPTAGDVLVNKYLGDLRDKQGLSEYSIKVYAPFVRAFVSTQRLPEGAAALDGMTVRNYLLEKSRDRSVSYVKLLRAALCSFLRFCLMEGITAADLSTTIPPVRRWQVAPVPPFLTAEEIERVIAATAGTTPRCRRDRAIILLLARLGLRATEIVMLDLDDIRWDAGEIVVRGKGRLHDRLPLLEDVGTALAIYLREARGASSSRRVFLRRRTPSGGLSGPSVVCEIARRSLRRAGLRPAGRVAAHIFRRSLATRMIRNGASLAEIAQVLRHRSINSTQIYAKVELEALREVAMPWPTVENS